MIRPSCWQLCRKYWGFWDKNSWEWRFIWDLERDLGQTDHRPSSDSNKSTWSDDNINTVSVSCFPSLLVYSVFEHSLSGTAPPYWHQMCFLADFWQDCKASVLLCSPLFYSSDSCCFPLCFPCSNLFSSLILHALFCVLLCVVLSILLCSTLHSVVQYFCFSSA